MCGLVAIVAPRGVKIDPDAFARKVSTLGHRGPDALNVEHLHQYGMSLGHTRLSIVDPLPRSDQPLHTEDVTVIFNGEIYNHRLLRSQLQACGVTFTSSGDTEVIAHGFEKWGVSLFEKLEGMYAIILLDRRSGTVFVTRDLFGIKPLYMQQDPDGRLSFASEVKALPSYRNPNFHEDTLFDMLTWGFQVSDLSFFDEVSHFPPGAVLRIDRNSDGTLSTMLTDRHRLRTVYNGEAKGRPIRRVLEDSVQDHLIADVPVAIALSGGLDSSIVAALAARQSPLTAFTLTLTDEKDEEVHHAALVCRKFGLTHRVLRMEVINFEGLLGEIAHHLEEPIANINVMLTYGLAAAVSQNGFKAILMGEGGDEIFAGYPWYSLCREAELRDRPAAIFEAYRRRRSQKNLQGCLTKEAQARLLIRQRSQTSEFVNQWSEMTSSCLNRFLYFDQRYQMQFSQLLRVDRMTMAHGVEARVPFLYESVATMAAALKDREKIRQHWYQRFGRDGKIALARAAHDLLPREVSRRPKFGARGSVNLWNSDIIRQMPEAFEVMLKSKFYAAARTQLERTFAWNKIESGKLSPKQKFSIMMILMSTHIHVCGLPRPQEKETFTLSQFE